MAKNLIGSVAYQPVVESISRKFTRKANTASRKFKAGPIWVAPQGWMGGAVRTSNRAGLGECKKNYLVIRENVRTSPVTAEEITLRSRFSESVRGANAILLDLMQLTQVQQMFITARNSVGTAEVKTVNGVSAYGYAGIRSWIMAVQYAGAKAAAEEGQSYNFNKFPTSFDA